MWMFTRYGFMSVVQDKRDPTLLQVRFRAEEHADAFLESCRPINPKWGHVIATPLADYPFRIVMPRNRFSTWMGAHAIDGIDYTNFKDAMKELGHGRMMLSLLHDVWATVRHTIDERANRPHPALRDG